MAELPQKECLRVLLAVCLAGTLINGPQRFLLVPHATICFSLATTMGKKNKGPIPCTLCDHSFASIPNMQQAGCFPTFPGKHPDFLPQHVRDMHSRASTPAPAVPVSPPLQEPQAQVKPEPVRAPLSFGRWLNAKPRN